MTRNVLIVLLIMTVSLLIFRLMLEFFNNTNIKPLDPKHEIIDTKLLVKTIMNNLFETIKTPTKHELSEFCTDNFLISTDYCKNLLIDFSAYFDYVIVEDSSQEVKAMMVGKSYEIRTNYLRFKRINNNLKLEEIT
jgi:hypothetical protein